MGKARETETTKAEAVAKTLGLQGRRRGGRLWLLAGGLLLLAVAGAFLFGRGGAVLGLGAYETAQPARDALVLTVAATGEIRPINEVEVGAEISGLIAEVLVDYNDRVTEGQVLARLDTEQLEARVLSARANLAQARAGVLQAEATVTEARAAQKRTSALAERSIASAQELDVRDAALARAQAGVESAKAVVMVAEAELAVAESNLRKTEIRSPVDGIVLDRRIEPGQTVAASFQTPVLFVLAQDLTQMELHVDIDEADIGRVREGQQARFTVDAFPRETFTAEVTQIRNAPQKVNNVVTYQGILFLHNPGLLLKPGMTADTDIITQTIENALLVPNASLRFTPPTEEFAPLPPAEGEERLGRVWVWRTGGPEPVPLILGESDGSRTEILKGDLAETDTVLVNLKSGSAASGGGFRFGPPRRPGG
ncbi:MAG: efflux RND transporter periplasmic adaptor subunit [Alphaproteobacteria bacterium]|nr:efflux RND transporter periplasmic adaptor subunit [Alphaproteobacteria bacterium]